MLKKHWVGIGLGLVLALVGVKALADYLGPDRTVQVQVWQRRECHYEALYDPPEAGWYSCQLNLYYEPGASCPAVGSVGEYFNWNECRGWPVNKACRCVAGLGDSCESVSCSITLSSQLDSCTEGETGCRSVEQTITYPEATVQGTLENCDERNGWCVTLPRLVLTGHEPLNNHFITGIEGTHNGEPFYCEGASCQIPLLEGENAFTFWAFSSWGDSSRLGSLTARVDTRPPQIEGSLSGVMGEGGWYVSSVTVSASASDPQPGSGIDAFTYAWNASPAQPYTGPITVGDGVHTLTFRAQDLAGHVSEISQRVQVDTLPPQVSGLLTGEQVGGWYAGQVTFTAEASDAGSGVARVDYALDGASWQAYTAPLVIGDGEHTLGVRAFDVAGNVGETRLAFRVDGTPPRIAMVDRWYIWDSVAIEVEEGGSGLAEVVVRIADKAERWPAVVRTYRPGGSLWREEFAWDRRFGDGTLAPVGAYWVEVAAVDVAGNGRSVRGEVVIPAPGEPTVTPGPRRTPTVWPTATVRAAAGEVGEGLPAMPAPSVTPGVVTFRSSNPSIPSSSAPQVPPSSNVLWGGAALGLLAALTAAALEAQRRRREAEARARAEAQAANAFVGWSGVGVAGGVDGGGVRGAAEAKGGGGAGASGSAGGECCSGGA